MNWAAVEQAETEAYRPLAAIAAIPVGVVAVLLVLKGWDSGSFAMLAVGSQMTMIIATFFCFRYLAPVPTEFLEAVAAAEWSPAAMKGMKALTMRCGSRLSLRDYRRVEAIQKRRDVELALKKDRAARIAALDSIRLR